METLVYDDFSVVHPHQLHTEGDLRFVTEFAPEPHQISFSVSQLSKCLYSKRMNRSERPALPEILMQQHFMSFWVHVMLQLP